MYIEIPYREKRGLQPSEGGCRYSITTETDPRFFRGGNQHVSLQKR